MEEILQDQIKFAQDITMLGKMLYELRYLKSPHPSFAQLGTAEEFFN